MNEIYKYDSASKFCKSLGLSSLNELSQICNRPVSTLNDWWNNNKELFCCVAVGAATLKSQD